MAKVQPHPTAEYTTGSASHPILPPTPLRGIILAPSGGGKTVLLVSLLLDMYRGAFARIYVFSPSVDIDAAWRPVKEYIEKDLGVDEKKEPYFFNSWDPEALQVILNTQAKMVEYQKKHKYKKIHGICVIVDDFADDPTVMHSNSNLLSTLFMRGRCLMCSTILSTQKYRAMATMIRTNAQFPIVFRSGTTRSCWLSSKKSPRSTPRPFWLRCTSTPRRSLSVPCIVSSRPRKRRTCSSRGSRSDL